MAVIDEGPFSLQMCVKKGENAVNQNIFNVFNNQDIFVSRKHAQNPNSHVMTNKSDKCV